MSGRRTDATEVVTCFGVFDWLSGLLQWWHVERSTSPIRISAMTASPRRVSYFYDAEVGNYHYGQGEYGSVEVVTALSFQIDRL
jgi:hypothetical protein